MSSLKLFRSGFTRVLFFTSLVYSSHSQAGFLDMPEITETPQLRGKTMVRDIDIPGVRDRNPDPESGPRLAVKEFRIQGLVEYPDLGITRDAINQMVENIRRDLMADDKLLPSGYTIKELGELSDLLVEIEDETLKRHVTPLEVQRLVWLVREQRSKRGIHLGQIEAIADRITRFYRERGFILAKAYIPKQEVRDGIVTLTLLLGMLGEVDVKGNKQYATDDIKEVFDDMLTRPVTNAEVEENLYLLNDYPGLSVDGYFEPGYQVGDTKLNVNVKQEKWFNSNLRVDNHGTSETGRNRFYADFQFNNLLGQADALQLSALKASSPSNTEYWKVFYRMNLFSPRLRLLTNYSRNQFIVDQSTEQGGLDIEGIVTQKDIGFQYIMKRSRTTNYNTEFKYENLLSDLQYENVPDPDRILDEEVENYVVKFNYDTLNEKAKSLHMGTVKYVNGNFLHGASAGQETNYQFMGLDYTFMSFIKVPLFDASSRIIIRSNLQYADTPLSSILKFSLGGPTRARAYSSNMFSADDGAYVGIDWVFNSPGFMDVTIFDTINLKEFVKPFIFVDYAYGLQRSLNAQEKDASAEVSDYGFGLQFAKGSNFRGNLMMAFPYERHFENTSQIPKAKGRRIVFDFQYSF